MTSIEDESKACNASWLFFFLPVFCDTLHWKICFLSLFFHVSVICCSSSGLKSTASSTVTLLQTCYTVIFHSLEVLLQTMWCLFLITTFICFIWYWLLVIAESVNLFRDFLWLRMKPPSGDAPSSLKISFHFYIFLFCEYNLSVSCVNEWSGVKNSFSKLPFFALICFFFVKKE